MSIKQEKKAWIDFLKDHEDGVEEEKKENSKIEVPSHPDTKTISQKQITDFIGQPPDGSKTLEDPEGIQLRSEAKGRRMSNQSTKTPNKPQKKLTQYFGIKVKGESGQGEMLE